MGEQEIKKLVEMCWRIADEAELPGTDKGMAVAGVTDQFGKQCVNSCRLNLFHTLLASLLPKGKQDVRHIAPKEKWEPEDDG